MKTLSALYKFPSQIYTAADIQECEKIRAASERLGEHAQTCYSGRAINCYEHVTMMDLSLQHSMQETGMSANCDYFENVLCSP